MLGSPGAIMRGCGVWLLTRMGWEPSFSDQVREGSGAGGLPRGVYKDTGPGCVCVCVCACVCVCVESPVSAHPTHPHSRKLTAACTLAMPRVPWQAMWVTNGARAMELVPPGLTSFVPMAPATCRPQI